jgi:hypothetical protein
MNRDEVRRAVVANNRFPSLTAQDVGRDLYHGRRDWVKIVGDKQSLSRIAWIFQRVPDMFEVKFQPHSLIVRRTHQYTPHQKTPVKTYSMPMRHGERSWRRQERPVQGLLTGILRKN